MNFRFRSRPDVSQRDAKAKKKTNRAFLPHKKTTATRRRIFSYSLFMNAEYALTSSSFDEIAHDSVRSSPRTRDVYVDIVRATLDLVYHF